MPKLVTYRAYRRPRLLRHGELKGLAASIGLSPTYLCDVMAGRRPISLTKLKALCHALEKFLGISRAKALRRVLAFRRG